MIYEKYANLKYKYGNRHFWCRGYYVSTAGRNKRTIEEYIRNQPQEDYADDRFSIKEIALRVGYTGDIQFIRSFKKLENTTPGAYQRMMGGQNNVFRKTAAGVMRISVKQ